MSLWHPLSATASDAGQGWLWFKLCEPDMPTIGQTKRNPVGRARGQIDRADEAISNSDLLLGAGFPPARDVATPMTTRRDRLTGPPRRES